MKRTLQRIAWLPGLLLILSAGCGRSNSSAQAEQQNDPMSLFSPEPPSAARESSAPQAIDTGPDMQKLNDVLRAYVRATKRIPNDLNELVSSGFVSSLPAPPPGKRFAIVRHPLGYQVILVNK